MATEPERRSQRIHTPIIRRSLGTDVYGAIWDRLATRELAPGERLSDLHLSRELGVSRTPVREALHRLVQDGVVVYHPNRGFFVASFSARDVGEIFDIRTALETLALRTMAQKGVSLDLASQENALERVTAMLGSAREGGDVNEAASSFLEVDQGFHQWIINGSGNQRLIAMTNGLWGQITVFQRAGTHVPGWMDIALDQHREILAFLASGDIHDAAHALEHHILDMKARILAEDAPGLISSESAGEES
ncbi:MAG TPA: GntR family transcriptional regulator [Thermomicrobiales bacterium]|nr:GntR family transcriptional regulator [Thermomicrobiales bacterium]